MSEDAHFSGDEPLFAQGKREFHQPILTAAEHSWLKGMQITWEGDKRGSKQEDNPENA